MRAIAASSNLSDLSERHGPTLREQLDGAPSAADARPGLCMICGGWYDRNGDADGFWNFGSHFHPSTVRCRDCATPPNNKEAQAA